MSPKATSGRVLAWVSVAVLGLLLSPAPGAAPPPNLKLEALLIWGTNDANSPDPKQKPVTDEVLKKLHELPFKWTRYFVVNRKVFEVAHKTAVRVSMSEKCDLEVKNMGDTTVEVSLFGKHAHVLKRTQPLPKGDTLVLGGNAPNATSWFVVLKQTEAAETAQAAPGK
jgi:hypothetical protein